MATKMDNPLLSTWSAALTSAGITGVDLLSSSTDRAHETGSGEASFRWGNLIVRLIRDRGQDFMDLASAMAPAHYFSLDDFGVAQGWRSIENILTRQEPVALADELRELSSHRTELEDALSPSNLMTTRAATIEARKRREQAFIEKLKVLAEQSH